MPCCMGVFTVNTLNWCTLRNSAMSGAGAATVPTFQPVTWKVLPKLDTMKARAASPGKRAALWCAAPSNTMCSYTSSLMSSTSVGASNSCRVCMSCALQTVALGLCGLLMIRARVRGVRAALILPKSGRKVPGARGTRTALPPASSMLGT